MNPKFLFERNLKQLQLHESLKEKELLKNKIKQLDENIELMNEMKRRKIGKGHSWLTIESRRKWEQDWNDKTKAAREFTKRVGSIQCKIRRRYQQKEQKSAEQERIEKEEEAKFAQVELERQAKEKEENIKKRSEELAKKHKEIMIRLKLAKEGSPKKEYLYQKMTNEYKNGPELTELEKRKREIEEKRNAFKPINYTEIDEFSKKHDDLINKHKTEKKDEYYKKIQDELLYKKKVSEELKSKFTNQILKHEIIKKEQIKEKEEDVKKRYNRMKEYSYMIKEMYQPTIDELKTKELRKRLESLDHKPKRVLESVHTREISLSSNTKITHRHTNSVNLQKSSNSTTKQSTRKNSIDKKIPKKIDYLAELSKRRVMRKKMDDDEYKRIIEDPELLPADKYKIIMKHTEMMEQKALGKEMLASIKTGNNINFEEQQEISDLYINVIKEKLSLL